MVTHEHDLVRHFGGRIINITNGEIVYDEIVTGTNAEVLPEVELAQAMENAARPRPQYAMPEDIGENNVPYVDDVIAAITSTATEQGGAEK
jgi:cell division transport system ATP-binding protein